MHQTVATILKTTIEALLPQNVDVNNLVEDPLAAAMCSLQATVSTML